MLEWSKWDVRGNGMVPTELCWGELKELRHLELLSVNGRKILNGSLKEIILPWSVLIWMKIWLNNGL